MSGAGGHESSVLDHRFGEGDPYTLGVEEEYMLLDPESLDLVQHIETVLDAVQGDVLADRINAEAEASDAAGQVVTARDGFLRASTYYSQAAFFADGTKNPSRLVPTWEQHRAETERAQHQPQPAKHLKGREISIFNAVKARETVGRGRDVGAQVALQRCPILRTGTRTLSRNIKT